MIIGNPIIAAGSGGSGYDHTFDIPTVGSFTYNGSVQNILDDLIGYYADFMTISGSTTATNAGTYSVTVSLKDTATCRWRDGSTTSKNLSWTIAKAAPSTPILAPDTLNLNTDTTSATFTVTRDGNGTITATPSDPAITTVLIGTEVTVTLVDTTVAVGSVFAVDIGVAGGDNYLPYVGVCQCTVNVVETVPQGYIVFESEDGTSITVGKTAGKTWDGTVEYSTDNITWSTWNGNSSITGQYVYLRGINNRTISGASSSPGSFELTGTHITCRGRIDALLNYTETVQGTHPIMDKNAFNSLFKGCTSLYSAPILPAVTLSETCYASMFEGCSSLVKTPVLPTQTLEVRCYNSMFKDCTSLTTISPILATVLAEACCGGMFRNCISLTTMPSLFATTLTTYCYYNMFNGCTALKLSSSQIGDYVNEYRIPITGTGTDGTDTMTGMFASTGGTFTGTPTINTTYYTSNEVV